MKLQNPVLLQSPAVDQLKDAISKNRKTFPIVKSNGQKKEGLLRSFLVVESISRFDRTYTTRDNVEWPIFHEAELQEAFKQNEEQKCILSFQGFADGEFFVIARLWKHIEKKKKEIQNA